MAISFTNLGNSSNPDIDASPDASSYSNSSWTPPTNGLLICFTQSRVSSGTANVPSVSGNGLTWVQIATVITGVRRLSLFAADLSGSSAGVTTFDFSGQTQLYFAASFFYATGVDLSGGVAAAFVQAPTVSAGGSSTTGTVTLAAPANANNRPIAAFLHIIGEVSYPRVNWTEADDLNSGGTRGLETQWRSDAFETTASATWNTAASWDAIAAEIKAAAEGQTIEATGIASAEAFGSPSLVGSILASGIASAEAFGLPNVVGAIVASGLLSEEAFGLPQITVAPVPTIPTILLPREYAWQVLMSDPFGNRIDLVEEVITATVIRNENAVGQFSLTLPGSYSHKLFGKDFIVEIMRGPKNVTPLVECVGFVRRVQFARDSGGRDTIKLTGPDAKELLQARIVAGAAGSAVAQKVNFLDDMMKEIVAEALGSSAGVGRDLTSLGFSIEEDRSEAPLAAKAFSRKTVLSVLQALADESYQRGVGLYFDIIPYIRSNGLLGFRFVTSLGQLGADHSFTGPVPTVFSDTWGNLEEPELDVDWTNEVNHVTVGGEGEEADREIYTMEDTELSGASPWSRRESFVDARNLDSEALLAGEAYEELSTHRPVIRFTGKLKDSPLSRYGRNWWHGDRVACGYLGYTFSARVKQTRLELRSNGSEEIDAKAEAEITL
jgi:hypothetical protein